MRTGSERGRDARCAFSLIEILVSVAILSVGIVLVLEAMHLALASMSAAREILTAGDLCREKLDEIRLAAWDPGSLAPASGQGEFDGPYAGYAWRSEIRRVQPAGVELTPAAASNALLEVSVQVRREGASRTGVLRGYVTDRP